MGIYVTQVTPTYCGLDVRICCCAFDQRFVRNRLDSDGLFQQSAEQLASASRLAAVESERELVEIGIQMLHAHSSLMSSQQPAFEQRRDPMNTRHQLRCAFAASFQVGDFVPVVLVFQRHVTHPAIGMDYAARLDTILNKGNQTVCRRVHDAPHSDAADTGRSEEHTSELQ